MTNVKIVQQTNKPTNRRQKQYVPAIATRDIKTFILRQISWCFAYQTANMIKNSTTQISELEF